MESFVNFAIDNWIASLVWLVLLIAVFITESARGGKKLSAQQTTNLINKQNAVVLDVRPSKEFKLGHLPNAVNIPIKEINNRLKELKKHEQSPIIIVCKSGQHAGTAGQILNKEGFEQIFRLKGGIFEWQSANLPLVK